MEGRGEAATEGDGDDDPDPLLAQLCAELPDLAPLAQEAAAFTFDPGSQRRIDGS